MRRVVLAHATDFDGFRAAARALAAARVDPAAVMFAVGDAAPDLFAGAPPEPLPDPAARPVRVPRRYVELAETVVCHSAPERFALLYRLLVRLAGEPHLLEIDSDPDVHAALRMEKAVARDCHKMQAFVRFRALAAPDGPLFVAWFEPDHAIEERVAPFFVERFAPMRFAILTPRRSIRWDRATLRFGPGAERGALPAEDAAEALWLTYFASVFNPARLKVEAMTAEMPKKYWRNLPEAALIPAMIASAEARAASMIEAGPSPPPIRHQRASRRSGAAMENEPTVATRPGHNRPTLEALREEAAACRRCPLWRDATQVVFGEGPPDAEVMVVGEQPGDREDLAGRPFVGPAGAVFDAAAEAAGLDRSRVYVTNAVKHFKFEPRGKRRLHKKPSGGEIQACRWWLEREFELVTPRLVVGLGGTALQALLGRPVKITELRGRFVEMEGGIPVFATVHPSFILRIPDPVAKEHERQRFTDDLRQVAERIAGFA